jgi:nucleoside-diphosphate-sugar epimerase
LGAAGETYVVAEDDPVRVVDFYETIAAFVPGAAVVRRSRDHFSKILNEQALETKYGSQPVNSTKIKQETGWRPRESFKTSVSRFLQAI